MKIYAALHDDAHQGWVWLKDKRLPARSIVKILNPENGRSVYCEALQIDDNFLNRYNGSDTTISIADPDNSIVIGDWFRAKLGGVAAGVARRAEVAMVVKPRNCWWGQFRACVDHPQIVARVASWLGMAGLILGIVGLGLGVWSIYPKDEQALKETQCQSASQTAPRTTPKSGAEGPLASPAPPPG